jgi:hypothetical protein
MMIRMGSIVLIAYAVTRVNGHSAGKNPQEPRHPLPFRRASHDVILCVRGQSLPESVYSYYDKVRVIDSGYLPFQGVPMAPDGNIQEFGDRHCFKAGTMPVLDIPY